MSDTKQYDLSQLQMTGPAVLCVYDDTNDYFYRIGYLDGIRLRRETDNVYQSEIHKSRSVAIDGLSVAERWFLNFSVKERLHPDINRLLFKNCGEPSFFTACSLMTVTEVFHAFHCEAKVMLHNSGFYGDGALPAPTNAASSAGGAGATIPAGRYVIVVEAVYTDESGLNPVRSTHDAAGGTNLLLGEQLTVTWDAPGGGYLPSYYRVYEYDTLAGESLVDADLIAVVAGTGPTAIIFSSFTDMGDWPGTTAGGAFTVTDESGGTTYTAGDDYTIDNTCARFAVIEDGDIEDGQLVKITYTYIANPYYTQSIGPGARNPKVMHYVIKWLKDDDRTTPVGRGCEIHLPHVHSESGFEWMFDQMDFESGFDQEYRVLLDRCTGKYGDIYTFHRVMENWDLKDLETLSKYASSEACSVVSS